MTIHTEEKLEKMLISEIEKQANGGGPNCNKYFKEEKTDHEKLLENGDIFYAKPEPQLSNPMSTLFIPKSKFAWKESYQWLKIIGLSIGLGVMVYQTYLLKLISEK